MKTKNNKIIEITESELFTLYLKRGMDDIKSFDDYKSSFLAAGCVILDDNEWYETKGYPTKVIKRVLGSELKNR